eukprot:scaffold318_cov269-Pinguiococcus_pyrenoidosus.AAC.7
MVTEDAGAEQLSLPTAFYAFLRHEAQVAQLHEVGPAAIAKNTADRATPTRLADQWRQQTLVSDLCTPNRHSGVHALWRRAAKDSAAPFSTS